MRIDTIYAYTQNLGVGIPELRKTFLNSRNLPASGRGEIQGVKQQHDMLPITKLTQFNGSAELIIQREIRGLITDICHGHCSPRAR